MTGFTEQHIVAIDLGSSKIALIVAKVYGNDAQIIYYITKTLRLPASRTAE